MTSDILKINYELRQENIKLKKENAELKKEVKRLSVALSSANNRIKILEKQIEQYKKDEEARIQDIVKKTVAAVVEKLNKEHQAEVDKLNAKIKNLEAKLNIDSTNSGIPTSKQNIGKHIIQNNREKSGNKRGGQSNHKQHKLEYFKDEEITKTEEITLDKCPICKGELKEKNVAICDVIDIKVKITKVRNKIHNYYCSHCHKNVSGNDTLPRGVVYGDNINSIALSMMNESNTALNKITSFINGITNNEINMSEGYLVKLQKKAAKRLNKFMDDLNKKIITLNNVHWDDTVCKFGIEEPEEGFDEKDKKYLENKDTDSNVRQGVIRFYGDDKWALLIGHRSKNKGTIEEDNILPILPETCTVVHDHLLLNYNEKYEFKNAECNQHTLRYLKKNIDVFPNHEWAKRMRKLLSEVNDNKKDLMKNSIYSFDKSFLEEVSNNYDDILLDGYVENNKVDLVYIKDKTDENNLLDRLSKFKQNHLMFAYDFSVEFTNNTAEKGLRQVKRKLAVSFMFKNANRMKDYANILSYLESCFRNGISRYDAAKRLVQCNPYSVSEIEKIIEKNEKKL